MDSSSCCPYVVVCSGSGFSKRGSGPEGDNDLELKNEAGICALRLGFEPRGCDLSHEVGI